MLVRTILSLLNLERNSINYSKMYSFYLFTTIQYHLGAVGIEKEPEYSPCQNIEVKVSKRSLSANK